MLYFNGRYQEAEAAARSARTWTLVGFLIGVVALIGWISFLSTGSMSGYMDKIIENSASGYNF